jgi:transcriptional regulator with XRE-family HTH domain
VAPSSPVVARWDLGRRLREKRDVLGLTGASAGRLVGMSPTFMSDMESGKKTPPGDKLDRLIAEYEVDAEEAAELRGLREACTQRGWWSKFNGLFSAEILRLFGYEHGADVMLTYDSSFVHGLLQTRDYARAVIEAGSPNIRLAEVDRRLEARMIRQHRLTGDDPLKLTVVLSEAALHQQIGGREVLRAQLRHLVDMIEQHPDTLDFLVVPFSAPGHPALGGNFHLLSFPSSALPNLAWLETVTSTELIDDPTKVTEFSLAHAGAAAAALSKHDSLALLLQVSKEI